MLDPELSALVWTFGIDLLLLLICCLIFVRITQTRRYQQLQDEVDRLEEESRKQQDSGAHSTASPAAATPVVLPPVVTAPPGPMPRPFRYPLFIEFWMRLFFNKQESEQKQDASVDGTMYLRFSQVIIVILVYCGLIGMCVLMPLNLSADDTDANIDHTWLEHASAENLPYYSNRVWVIFGATLLFSFLSYALVWYFGRDVRHTVTAGIKTAKIKAVNVETNSSDDEPDDEDDEKQPLSARRYDDEDDEEEHIISANADRARQRAAAAAVAVAATDTASTALSAPTATTSHTAISTDASTSNGSTSRTPLHSSPSQSPSGNGRSMRGASSRHPFTESGGCTVVHLGNLPSDLVDDIVLRGQLEAQLSLPPNSSEIVFVHIALDISELEDLTSERNYALNMIDRAVALRDQTGRYPGRGHVLWCGCCRTRRGDDALTYYTALRDQLNAHIKHVRNPNDTGPAPVTPTQPSAVSSAAQAVATVLPRKRSTGHAFVAFSTAHLASHCVRVLSVPSLVRPTSFRNPDGSVSQGVSSDVEASLAPPANDIIWNNLVVQWRWSRFLIANFVLFVVMLVIITPVTVLDRLESIIHRLDQINEHQSYAQVFLLGYFPTIIIFLINSVLLPYLIALTADYERHWLESQRAKSVLQKNALFFFINALLLPTLALNSIAAFLEVSYKTHWDQWGDLIGNVFLSSAGQFFIVYLIHASLLGTGTALVDLPQLIYRSWYLRHAITEDEKKQALQIHDELLFEVRKDKLTQVKNIVRDVMERCVPKLIGILSVRLKTGESWGSLKPIQIPPTSAAPVPALAVAGGIATPSLQQVAQDLLVDTLDPAAAVEMDSPPNIARANPLSHGPSLSSPMAAPPSVASIEEGVLSPATPLRRAAPPANPTPPHAPAAVLPPQSLSSTITSVMLQFSSSCLPTATSGSVGYGPRAFDGVPSALDSSSTSTSVVSAAVLASFPLPMPPPQPQPPSPPFFRPILLPTLPPPRFSSPCFDDDTDSEVIINNDGCHQPVPSAVSLCYPAPPAAFPSPSLEQPSPHLVRQKEALSPLFVRSKLPYPATTAVPAATAAAGSTRRPPHSPEFWRLPTPPPYTGPPPLPPFHSPSTTPPPAPDSLNETPPTIDSDPLFASLGCSSAAR